MHMKSSLNMKKQMEEKPPLEPEPGYWETNIRLPPTVHPVTYDLLFRPKFSSGRFFGTETIAIDVTEATNFIVLHAKNLIVKSTKVTDSNDVKIPVKKAFPYEVHEFWVITFDNRIPPGKYTLEFDFEGVFKDRSFGVFRGSNVSESGASRYFLASNFLPMDARLAFLCFDEPVMVAKFKIRLVRPIEGYIAISNETMEKEEFGPDPNEVTVNFRETPLLPPSHVLLLVSNLAEAGALEVKQGEETLPVRIHTTPDMLDKTDFAKSVTSQLLIFYGDYFGTPCPSSKLDLVAVKDYPKESHEFWGAVTFRNDRLLSTKGGTYYQSRNIAMEIAGKLSLLWFGNLVTLKWWDDLWLKESFMRYMQYKSLEEGVREFASYNMLEPLFHDYMYSIMDEDADINSRPLNMCVDSLDAVRKMFGWTSVKGLAVLRMLESFVGRESFRRGVNRYLSEYRFVSAGPAALWQCMNAEAPDAKLDIMSFMDTWTMQAGYPLIYAIKRVNTWILSQSRYLLEQDSFYSLDESPFRYKWDMPVSYVTSNSNAPQLVLFERGSECVKLPISDRSISFLKLNHNQIGFFRVNYEGCIWGQFVQLLMRDHLKLNSIDRANLLDDVFALAESGYTDYAFALDMLRYLEAEKDFLPWSVALRNMKKLFYRLMYTPSCDSVLKLLRVLVEKLYGHTETQYCWCCCESASHTKKLVAEVILELACLARIPFCISALAVKFKEWIKSGKISTGTKRCFLIHGMRETGSFDEWKIVHARYEEEADVPTKMQLLECLANSNDPWALMKLFEDFLAAPRSEEMWILLATIADNPRSCNFEWEIIKNEWDRLIECLSIPNPRFDDLFLYITRKFATNNKLEEVKTFIEKHPKAFSSPIAAKRGVEGISRNIKWVKKHEHLISSWLSANAEG